MSHFIVAMKAYNIIVLIVVVVSATVPPTFAMEDDGMSALLGKIVQAGHNLEHVKVENEISMMENPMKKLFEIGPNGRWGTAAAPDGYHEYGKLERKW